MSQAVWASRVLANGGRHARTERYQGRHRKPGSRLGLGAGARVTVTLACAALFVCLPQPGWADHAGTVRAHAAAVSRAAVTRLPGPLRPLRPARPA